MSSGKHFDFIIIDDKYVEIGMTENCVMVCRKDVELTDKEIKALRKWYKKYLKTTQKTDNKTGEKTDNKEVKTTTKST